MAKEKFNLGDFYYGGNIFNLGTCDEFVHGDLKMDNNIYNHYLKEPVRPILNTTLTLSQIEQKAKDCAGYLSLTCHVADGLKGDDADIFMKRFEAPLVNFYLREKLGDDGPRYIAAMKAKEPLNR